MITVKKEKVPKCKWEFENPDDYAGDETYVAWVARDDQVPDFYVAIQPKKGRDAKSLALEMYNEELPGWLERHQ